MKRLSVLEATALLVGTQIGAGVLGLPSALKKTGWGSVAVIVVTGFLTLVTALVILRISRGGESISELAQSCLGRLGGAVMMLGLSVLIYGAMIAYIASSGELLKGLFGIDELLGSLIFWAALSLVVAKGLKLSGEVELFLNFLLLASMITAVAMVTGRFDPANLAEFDVGSAIKGVGVVAFAFVSHMLIPEIRRGLGDYDKSKTTVVLGFVIPMFFYTVFTLGFIGALGKDTPEIATKVLEGAGGFGKLVGLALPFLAISTSYIGVGLAQMRNFEGFFKMRRSISWILTVVPPLLIFLAGVKSFVKALWIGGTFGGILYAGILPVLMYYKCCKRSRRMDVLVGISGGLFVLVLIGSL